MGAGQWPLGTALILLWAGLGAGGQDDARAAGGPAQENVTGVPADAGGENGPAGIHESEQAQVIFPILENGRWGFIDNIGRVAIRPRFESTVAVENEIRMGEALPGTSRPRPPDLFMASGVGPESTWTIGVRLQGKWVLVNQQGAMQRAPRFDRMEAFSDGMAAVQIGDLWGFVNGSGRLAIAPRFDDVGQFCAGLCVVTAAGKWGVIDRGGQFVVQPRFEFIRAADSVFHDNRAVVVMGEKKGYVSRAGVIAVPAIYDDARPFSEGLAAVVRDGRTGYIDTTGRVVIAPRFETGEPFDRGLALVVAGGKYGFIDRGGEFVAKPVYDEASSFAGKELAPARKGGRVGTVDRSGRWNPTSFVELLPIDDSLAIGRVGSRTGVVRRASGALIQPYPWEDVAGFSEGLAAVRNRGTQYGFIDPAGTVVVPPRFDDVDRFRHGLCKVAAGDTLGYVSRSGAWVWFGRFRGYRAR